VRYDPQHPEKLAQSLDQILMGPFISGFFGLMSLFAYIVKALGF
jgi:hypothetical protein